MVGISRILLSEVVCVEIRLVDREEALRNAAGRRTKWTLVLEQVRNAPEGKAVEVVLWSNSEALPRNHTVRLYNIAALIRARAVKMGMRVNVYRGADGRRLYIERVA